MEKKKDKASSSSGPRKDRELMRQEEIRLSILRAAEKIILDKGYTAMTVDDVAREAGLSKTTMYKYVPSKGRILFEIVNYYLDEGAAKVERLAGSNDRASDKLRAIIAESIRMHQAKNNVGLVLMMDRSMLKLMRLMCGVDEKAVTRRLDEGTELLKKKNIRIIGLVARIIEEGTAAGEFRPIDPMEAVAMIGSLLEGINHNKFWQPGLAGLSEDELADRIFDFVYSSLRRPENAHQGDRT